MEGLSTCPIVYHRAFSHFRTSPDSTGLKDYQQLSTSLTNEVFRTYWMLSIDIWFTCLLNIPDNLPTLLHKRKEIHIWLIFFHGNCSQEVVNLTSPTILSHSTRSSSRSQLFAIKIGTRQTNSARHSFSPELLSFSISDLPLSPPNPTTSCPSAEWKTFCHLFTMTTILSLNRTYQEIIFQMFLPITLFGYNLLKIIDIWIEFKAQWSNCLFSLFLYFCL